MLERATRAVLDAAGQVPGLWDRYVVKGGLALQYVYGSPRQTQDLDFNTVRAYARALPEDARGVLHAFCDALEAGLGQVAPRYGFARLDLQFREFLNEMPVLYIRVGYTHVPERQPPSDDFVEMQVTLGDQICETREADVDGLPVRVPVLEDIVADKLRVLLQQPDRRIFRSSDLFDLWYRAAHLDGRFDRARVVRFLDEETRDWHTLPPVTKASYRDPAVKLHAAIRYDDVRAQLPPSFVPPPVDEAYDALLRLVDSLDLPDD